MLPEGEDLLCEEVDISKPRVEALKKLLWEKKKASFEKVEFARRIAIEIEEEDVPAIVKSTINRAIELARCK